MIFVGKRVLKVELELIVFEQRQHVHELDERLDLWNLDWISTHAYLHIVMQTLLRDTSSINPRWRSSG